MPKRLSSIAVSCLAITNLNCGPVAPDSGREAAVGVDAAIPVCTPEQFPIPYVGCGGDLDGTWKLSCYYFGGAVSVVPSTEQTYTFYPNGQYNLTATGELYFTVKNVLSIPEAIDGGTSAETCAMLNDIATRSNGICALAGGECSCTYPTSSIDQSDTYTTSGNVVTLKEGSILVGPEYCVAGNTLILPDVRFGNFQAGGVFTKQ